MVGVNVNNQLPVLLVHKDSQVSQAVGMVRHSYD